MPDFQQFKITPLAAASVTVPRAQIEALVTDSRTQAVIADFTGANAILFPRDITDLTAADRQELAQIVAYFLIRKKAGL
jgi:hypothetical protein